MPSVHSGLRACALACTLLLGACAHQPQLAPLDPEAIDRLPAYNRWMFGVNEKLDEYLLKPVAQGYQAVTPQFLDDGITNIFGNLADLPIGINNLLQFKFREAAQDFTRIVFNSTFGLLGFFDVASYFGIPKHDEDFGQTLAHWGVGEGSYFVLPLLGPSTLRDTGGLAVDAFNIDPVWEINRIPVRNSLVGLRIVDKRADLLRSERVTEGALLDRYTQIRDAWLQRRRSLIYDGNAPLEPRRLDVD